MTQYPTQPPQPMDYQNPPPPAGGMAKAAMILGIAAVPLILLFGLGILLGLIALILGIIALVRSNRDPYRGGKGFAITGIILGGVSLVLGPVFALLIAILLPSLGKARELSNRTICAANLRGIMQSMVVYAANNDNYYPYAGKSPVSSTPTIGTDQNSVTGSMFILVSDGQVAPKQFLCKSDPANTGVSSSAGPYWNSAAGPDYSYSYSFAYSFSSPIDLGAWWRNTTDAGCPIAADMNPGSQSIGRSGTFNSPNHQGDGQNVGFADGHAEFCRTPAIGEGGDNIWNVNSKSPSPGLIGPQFTTSPGGKLQGTFDTYMVPAITDTTAYTRK